MVKVRQVLVSAELQVHSQHNKHSRTQCQRVSSCMQHVRRLTAALLTQEACCHHMKAVGKQSPALS